LLAEFFFQKSQLAAICGHFSKLLTPEPGPECSCSIFFGVSMTNTKFAPQWNTPDVRKLIFHAAIVADMILLFILATIPGFWNLNGAWLPAWPLPMDLVLFGGLYYFLFRPSFQEFLTKGLLLAIAGAVFGYFALPHVREALVLILGQNQVAVALAYGFLEVLIAYLVVQKIRSMLRVSGNVESALRSGLSEKFGTGWLGRWANFEARIWYYGLFMRKGAKLDFEGKEHFSYANNDGNVHHQFCVVMLLVFDMPVSHFVTHLAVSAKLAWLVTVLGAWNVLYFVAQYRATKVRPVSLDENTLYLRYGVFSRDRHIPLRLVARAIPMKDSDERLPRELRYRQFGSLNVAIELHAGAMLPNFFGVVRPVRRIAISIDDPARFMQSVNQTVGAHED
jgi:hypothetical protein